MPTGTRGATRTALRPATSSVPPVPSELDQADVAVRADAAWFWWAFAETDDLAQFTPAARRMLAVGSALFLRRGAEATSVRDIARAAGVSPGALYNHFESKEQLLYTVVRYGHHRLVHRLDLDVPEGPPPVDRLGAFVAAWVTGHLEHQPLALLVRREYVHLTGARRSAVVRQRREIRDRLAGIVAAGVTDGSFRRLDGDDDPTPVAVMILDMCLSIADWYDPTRGRDVTQLADRYVSAALRLLGAA